MINTKALAIALSIGVMTATSGIAHASDAKSPAEFQTMINKIHASQAKQRTNIMKNVGTARAKSTKSPAEFQAMIKQIHTRQASQRADIKGVTRGTGAKSPAEFQAMIDKIHVLQAKNRAKVWEIVKKFRSSKTRLA